MADNDTTDAKAKYGPVTFEKKIPLGDGSEEAIAEEKKAARKAKVELNIEENGSFILLRVEIDNKKSEAIHKLKSDGWTLIKN